MQLGIFIPFVCKLDNKIVKHFTQNVQRRKYFFFSMASREKVGPKRPFFHFTKLNRKCRVSKSFFVSFELHFASSVSTKDKLHCYIFYLRAGSNINPLGKFSTIFQAHTANSLDFTQSLFQRMPERTASVRKP